MASLRAEDLSSKGIVRYEYQQGRRVIANGLLPRVLIMISPTFRAASDAIEPEG